MVSYLTQVEVGAEPLIIAIDPGLTTGVAAYRHTGIPWLNGERFSSGQVEGRFHFYKAFNTMVAWGLPIIVVMERFTITPATAKKSPQPDPIYIIGAIERQADDLGFPFYFQTPSDAMSFATDDKLKLVGFWNRGKGHANDAARHMLKFLIHKRPDNGGNELLEKIVEAIS